MKALRLCFTMLFLASLTGGPTLLPAGVPMDTAPPSRKKLSDPKEIAPVISEPPQTSSPWQVEIGLPAWATSIDGTVGVKGITGDVSQSFSSIWQRTDWVFPLAMDIRYHKWGFHVDGQVAQLSERFDTRGILFNSGTVKMQQAFANFNLNYLVVDTERWQVRTSVGGRFNYMSLEGTLESRFPRFIPDKEMSGSIAWVDPVLGLETKVHIYKPLSLQMMQDVGGFGVGSHITYQFYGGAIVQLTRSLSMDVGYRYIHTDYSNDGAVYNVDTKGPQLGFKYKF